jgi:DNA helicase II / ATP-dependent DNA helicase PcrA
VRDKYARRYEQVLVDEFQDTNLAQYLLLKHLSSFHRNIFLVGDTDQSIYRWRGADYRNVQRFEKDYPDTQVILLEQNYRSTQNILDAAMAVIDRNPQRIKKNLFTEKGSGPKIVMYEAFDDRVEASFVIETIARRVANNQSKPGNFAIMYRTNAQSRVLEEAFLHAGLPYKLVGAQRFYGRREVKDVIAYLRLAHNPSDEISLTRVINVPPRGIGDKTLQALRTEALRGDFSMGRLLLEIALKEDSPSRSVFSGRAAGSLTAFGKMLANWRASASELPPLKVMDLILSDTDYQDYLDDGSDEGRDRWDNVLELRRLAAEFTEPGLEDFLERVALVSDQDTIDASAKVPTLLTLHAAKGLEYPVVFIVGLDDGTLPHSRSQQDQEEMMEERRLMYVGITRAMECLYLVYPLNRSSYGFAEPVSPSRFLDDIPPELIEYIGQTRRIMKTNSRARESGLRPDRWESRGNQPLLEPRFKAGARVRHPMWGEGMVLNSRIQDDDEIVDIFFENMGLKKVAASLARLDVIT